MAIFGTIKNTINCSISALGTGTENCPFEIKLINGCYAVRRGTTIADSDEFDKAFMQGLIQEGKAIALLDVIGFTDNSADDTIQTTQSGVEIVANLGRYMFSLEYKKGEYFNKALSSLDSFGVYDIILVDEAGNWLMTENKSGVTKGFKAGRFTAEKRAFNDGTVATSKSITFQLLDRAEFDSRLVWIADSETDFSPEEVNGVNDINITFKSAPTSGATEIGAVLKSSADNTTALSGLDSGNFLVLVNGADATPTVVESTVIPGEYAITVTALATDDDLVIKLYDIDIPGGIILVGDLFYQSNKLEAVVV